MTPQIDCLGETSTVLRVSTHIYGVSKEIHWKTFIFRVNLGMWPLKSIILEKRALFWGSEHTFMGFLRRKMGKHSFLEYTYACHPSNRSSWKNEHCSEGFNTHLWSFQGHRWENMNVSTKPRHVTPQINCLGETSTVLRVSTHIYGVSKDIGGKMFIFRVHIRMWPLKSIVSEKRALFWGFQHTFMGFLRR